MSDYRSDPSIVLALPLNEGTGTTAYDYSGNANNGTLVNTPTWKKNNFGGSYLLLFNGTTQRISIGTNDLTTGAFSFSFWVNASNITDKSIGTLKLGTSIIMYLSSGNGGNTFFFGFRGTDSGVYSPTNSLTANNWYHIIGTYNNGTKTSSASYKIYINGISQTLTQFSGTIGGSTTTNYLASDSASGYLPGKLSSFNLYSRIISQEEALANYNQTYRA